jgi:DNA helicase-2/ATP-dependent DNA helicase PcrA
MSHLESLNPAQREAVTRLEGPLLILAGPGSGKTRVITHRIAELLERGVAGSRILALTFTNKAADEMRRRVDQLQPGHGVWIGTFHRFCARLLRLHASLVGLSENFTILNSGDSRKALQRALDSLDNPPTMFALDQVATAISHAKSFGLTHEQFEPREGHPLGAIVAAAYPRYQQQLAVANAVDFDDLLLHTATILRENPELRRGLDQCYRYVMVDEYQDTNIVQYCLVRLLSEDHPNLAVTGDPDQSIYGWRGANVENILRFEQDYVGAHVVRLEQNYRSTPEILEVADELIAHNRRRKPKRLVATRDSGAAVRLTKFRTQKEEAEEIANEIAAGMREGCSGKEFAVFYRTNALSRSVERALRARGIPYQIVRGVAFYQRKEIKDLLAYLQVINNPHNDVALLRIINTPPRGIGRKTIDQLNREALQRGESLLATARSPSFRKTLARRSSRALENLVGIVERLSERATAPVEEILGRVLDETGYQDLLEAAEQEGEDERAGNVREMLNDAREFDEQLEEGPYLEPYLEQASLINDVDDWNTVAERVTLMTLHAAKGLEFPAVFIVGCEQGLLPHKRSRESPEQLEEERRLLFVGITRAQRSLHLTHVGYRAQRGGLHPAIPSEFLMELPGGVMDVRDLSDPLYDAYATDTFADRSSKPRREMRATSSTTTANLSLTTAASMLDGNAAVSGGGLSAAGEESSVKTNPDEFEQGMLVRHPEYGLGQIVSLSGSGAKRSAAIRFFTQKTEKKFLLAFSSLQPVRSQA